MIIEQGLDFVIYTALPKTSYNKTNQKFNKKINFNAKSKFPIKSIHIQQDYRDNSLESEERR